MGADKALLVVDGEAMAVRVAEALRQAGLAPVRAVGGDAAALADLGLEVVPDDAPGGGPLAATITALRHADEAMVAVLSCDLLTPSPTAVRSTVDTLTGASEAAVAVPVVAGRHQWVHAAWRTSALAELERAWQDGVRSLWSAAQRVAVVEVPGITSEETADADEPGDLPGRSAPSG